MISVAFRAFEEDGLSVTYKLQWSDTHYVAYMPANPPDKSD